MTVRWLRRLLGLIRPFSVGDNGRRELLYREARLRAERDRLLRLRKARRRHGA